VMTEFDQIGQTTNVLVNMGGWTLLTGINLMLFSLIHNPCSTTILTIWKETQNARWTAVAALLPLGLGFMVTIGTATIARVLGLA
jgi:ferrous iron transport protein B